MALDAADDTSRFVREPLAGQPMPPGMHSCVVPWTSLVVPKDSSGSYLDPVLGPALAVHGQAGAARSELQGGVAYVSFVRVLDALGMQSVQVSDGFVHTTVAPNAAAQTADSDSVSFAPSLEAASLEFAPFDDTLGRGVVGYDWSIGFAPGFDDIMPLLAVP